MPKCLFPAILFLCLSGCAPAKKSCDYPLFESAWNKISENYVEPVTGERLFSGALKVTEREAGKSVPAPKYARDAQYTPASFWLYHLKMAGKLPSSDACYSMIKEMVSSLQSRHSYYLRPNEKPYNELARTENGGIGFLFYKEEPDAPAIVYKVWHGSDADLNGVQAGDIITAIDGAAVKDMVGGAIAYYLRGKIGSLVEITILRRDGKTKKIDLMRERRDQSVYCENLPEGIPYCAILDFGRENVASTFLNELWKNTNYGKTRELILDFRFNPGGYLNPALSMAGYWTGGKKIMTTKDRNKLPKEIYGSGFSKPTLTGKTTILMNRHTASASEVVIGALQDNGLAFTVGEQTYGKGEIQYIMPLKDGSRLIIVSLYWYPPGGEDINRVGILPSYSVKTTAEDLRLGHDPQLEAALDIMK